jgi:cold shock protein
MFRSFSRKICRAFFQNNGKEKRLVEGHIKWYNEKKGYGFVTTEEYGDIFLHNSGIKEFGYFGLQSNDRVIFEIRETSKGKQAVNLRPFKETRA